MQTLGQWGTVPRRAEYVAESFHCEASQLCGSGFRPQDCRRPPIVRKFRIIKIRRGKAAGKEMLMSEKKAQGELARAKGTQKSAESTTKKAAKKAAARPGPRSDKANGESAVLAKIAAMPGPYRAMGERLHAVIKASAPDLSPKVWYGMPGYAKDGKVVCFFRGGQMFHERYMTLGFNNDANLDEGAMWPIAFALKELTAAEEAKIAALVKKAVS
jgi:hypothetical protein